MKTFRVRSSVWILGAVALASGGGAAGGCASQVTEVEAGATGTPSGTGGGGGAGGETGEGGAGGEACIPAAETCDGLDNSCDGQVDEGCACGAGEQQACYSGPADTQGVGACQPGTQACTAAGVWGDCQGEVTPGDEACNDADDDCDGAVDDMGTTTCGVGACSVTVETCTDGAPGTCTPLAPTPETCDGVDNDCDQLVDEADPMLGQACTTASPGVCAPGVLQCDGAGLVCVSNVSASPEICDMMDNDCDGGVDDGIPGTGSACSSGFPGVCSPGVTACQGGAIDCVPLVMASPEICDGLDNDCDGQADDGDPEGGGVCNTGNPGICAPGVLHCVSGSVQCVADAAAQPDGCNGVDDDCDGAIDEGNPGGGVACSTGQPGVCASGTTSCTGGVIVCNPAQMPTADVCNGADDDCDGQTDEGNPGGGAACSTGLQGVCAAGTITCTGGSLQCAQNVQPVPEICGNMLDDNCDGMADPPVVVYFNETFAGNGAGWNLGPNWAIGPTLVSSGQVFGNPDPALDHSPTADNRVAGVVLGGNAPTNQLHPYYYLTSPVINANVATPLYLEFWRWLNSDYTPFMANRVEVYNGSSWVTVFQTGAQGTTDNAWTKFSYDISAHKNANLQIRFGYTIGSSGVFTVSQWNVDDIQLTSALCN